MPFKIKKISSKPKINFKKKIFQNKINISGLKLIKRMSSRLRKIIYFRKSWSKFKLPSIVIGVFLVLMGSVFVYKMLFGLYSFVRDFSITEFVFSFGAELEKDSYSNTNILVIGIGGEAHEGSDLTDSQIVMSIDSENTVSMLSIPRDLHINERGSNKINDLFYTYKYRYLYKYKYSKIEAISKALEDFKNAFEVILDLDIQYYIKVDFKGLEELVDILGGIDINIEENIYDPYYPNDNWGYELFALKKGRQHLDGPTVLKYVRSRKTTSDFDRSRRQQDVILALKEKALSLDILTSPSKLKAIYDSLSKHIETNLEWDEILTLAELSIKINKETMISKVLHDDPNQEGGFLYTPDRSQYNNMFVLLPYGGGFHEIQKYTFLIFLNRAIYLNAAKIEILNGSKTPGLASKTYNYLKRFGFNIVNVDNTSNSDIYEKTVIIKHNDQHNVSFKALGRFINGVYDENIQTSSGSIIGSGTVLNNVESVVDTKDAKENPDITIILGKDFDVRTIQMIY